MILGEAMSKRWFVVIASLILTLAGSVRAQEEVSEGKTTLYSVLKYRGLERSSCLRFQPYTQRDQRCDVRYGALHAGDEWDWFESSAAKGSRSVIKDLGAGDWTGKLSVPVVEPLPALKPGEVRQYSVDASGKDGEDGKPGLPGRRGENGADADGVVRSSGAVMPEMDQPPPATASRPKYDGVVRVSSLWVKAIVGHMYLIRVVDDERDFYALFRVEDLTRGDKCTISWRLVPSPQASASRE